jgi:Holliday junction resolvase RusA-like endonuclease
MKLVAKVELKGHRIVPWSAPEHGSGKGKKTGRGYHFTKKDPALVAFQAALKRNAKATMKGHKPHVGPVYLRVLITRATPDTRLWGQWCFPPEGKAKQEKGDLTNWVKACEDAVKGVVFINDNYVCGQNNIVRWGEFDQVEVTTLAITPADALSN